MKICKIFKNIWTLSVVFTFLAIVTFAAPNKDNFISSLPWDAEYDVVVIGFGGAGAVTAITAADLGAKVLILEKAPLGEEGGNTKYAGQFILSPTDRESALAYYKALRSDYNNQSDEVLEFIVDGLMANKDWLIKLGVDPARLVWFDYIEFPEFGGKGMGGYTIDGWWTSSFWQFLRKNVVDRADKIDVWYSTPVSRLIQDKNTGIVHGVKIENKGKSYNVRAKNGVVMAMGGFENNDEMLENYAQLQNAFSKAARYNTGDGVKMAIDVGADLWHMSALAGPDVNFIVPETKVAAGYYFTVPVKSRSATGFTSVNTINVGTDGTRFMSETVAPRHGHVNKSGTFFSLLVPKNAWCIFDETARSSGVVPYFTWSSGFKEELAKGWVIKANTIKELAEKMSIPAEKLEKTVQDYNNYCTDGYDPDFHVDSKYLKPIATAPYYAFPLQASLTNTQGGAKRNAKCEVLDVWGNPIPHLYSAGEFGSFYTDIYNGGGNLGECAFTGREAGKNAATPKNDTPADSALAGKKPVDLRPVVQVIDTQKDEYIGRGTGIGGEIVVKITYSSGRIGAIEVVSNSETVGIADRALVEIPKRIIAAQSNQVDVIAGASITSKGIMEAVQDAVNKAK
ncbi:MAG: FAD-binding protein [Fusobacteriaceae bacterium]|nr:FAD-binding protein [Fusobacteriaceae bacterium]